jgi:cold shock CspA family protein
MASSVETSSVTERHTGRVKWFNSKTGYGFVTVTDGSKSGTDVFVHHSSVQVEKEQYRYLVQGEYVQFGLTKMTEGPHEYQASHVTGVNGGQLMCESLLESGRQVRAYRPRPREEAPRREAPRRTEALPPPMPREDTRRQTTSSVSKSVDGRGRGSGRGRTTTSSGRGRGRGSF